MALAFADTHNMIAFLTKSDASKGFEQIIDFLNTSVIRYALMVNLTIYVSCIKQFWSSVSLKKTNDVVRLQALIDRKKVIITEDTVRQALRLDDADSIDCLPNEEIFVELVRMGYEKPPTKLTFYKAFFSAQLKFLIHTILQCMSAKRTVWNEFSSSMASAIICLATGRKFNFSKYIFDNLVRNVDSPSKFYMYPRFLQLMINAQIADLSSHNTKYTSPTLTQKVFANMRRVGKGFSGVDTLLFDGMLVPQQVQNDVVDAAEDGDAANEISAEPTPPSPTPATTPPPQQELIPSPSQLNLLHLHHHISLLLLNHHHPHHNNLLNMRISPTLSWLSLINSKAKGQEVGKEEKVESFMIQEIEEGGIDKLDANEDITLETVDVQGRLPESQAQVYHLDLEHADNVISMQEIDEAEPAEVEEVIKVVVAAKLMTEVVTTATTTATATPITVAPVPKASDPRRRRGVIIQDPEEAATASEIVQSEVKSKDKGKGILVKEPKPLKRQAQIKQDEAFSRELEAELNPKNFSDDFLLNAHKTMFEKPNVEANIWRNQRGRYGLAKVKSWKLLESYGVHIITFTTTQMILLVERGYPLIKFTLEQMLNNVRLEVKEESEMSLKLLRLQRIYAKGLLLLVKDLLLLVLIKAAG
uniref:Synaptobrevin, longin-like domain protein n=1 Tax=Tanacetum cinerariifolium TaxID=118510 RepID=A0A699GL86_TANCI|nr:hypothetical protein [Tanacetum cinerariifolium]